jgi:uncharacterized membrane protein
MAAQPIYQPQALPTHDKRLDAVMRRAGEITMEYWALAITIFMGLIVFAALSVPLLTYLGLDSIAKPLFFTLHLICAQIPSHSFYILGHQLGMCARNMGIYSSMFIGGLVFVLSKKRLPGIPWWVWVLMVLPMAYDGLTQMFGLRESTWELRVLTGALFGAGNMWFVLPFIQRTLLETVPIPNSLLYPTQTMQFAQVPAPITQPLAPIQISTQPLAPIQTFASVSQLDLETPLPPSDDSAPAKQSEEAGRANDLIPLDQPEETTPTQPTLNTEPVVSAE